MNLGDSEQRDELRCISRQRATKTRRFEAIEAGLQEVGKLVEDGR